MDRPEPFDPVTGEILHQPVERAADGALVPVPARTGGAMLDMLEDGAFGVDMNTQLAELSQKMKEHSDRTGMKCRGKVTITLDIERDGDAFRIAPEIKVTAPKMPRPRSTLWTDRDNNFTRFPPGQGQFFGTLKTVG
jgi:hypothetical protein